MQTQEPRIPLAGQRFVDSQGTCWRVQEVVRGTGDAFTVRLAFGVTPRCDHDAWELNHEEYEALARERRLAPPSRGL